MIRSKVWGLLRGCLVGTLLQHQPLTKLTAAIGLIEGEMQDRIGLYFVERECVREIGDLDPCYSSVGSKRKDLEVELDFGMTFTIALRQR